MKRYDQLILHDPPRTYGDCFSTCVRCLLELDEPIPNFCDTPNEWWERTQTWLDPLGLALVQVQFPDPSNYQLRGIGYHLIGGTSPRGFGHWVVGYKGQVAWDPHPSRAGLKGSIAEWDVGFLVAKFGAPKA